MNSLSLVECIKNYVYARQALEKDPDNDALVLRLAEICLQAGLVRTATELAQRVQLSSAYKSNADEITAAARNASDEFGRFRIVRCDMQGSVLVADVIANNLSKLTQSGETVWKVDKEGFEDDAIYRPNLLAVDNNGNSFIGCSILSRVQVFDSEGRFMRVFRVPLRHGENMRMESLDCNEEGNLWIADSISGKLIYMDSHGNKIR
jgi:streptogramin lyase